MPHSASATMRTCGNAPPPGPWREPGRPNACSLAGVSAASQQVPSTATSRSPRQHAPGVAAVASGRAVAANSTRSGVAPSRSRARNSDDLAGTRQVPHRPSSRSPWTRCRSTSRYGAGENSAIASTKYTTSRAGSSRRRCPVRSHAATTRSTTSGGYTQVNTPSPASSGTPSATGTPHITSAAPAAYAAPHLRQRHWP